MTDRRFASVARVYGEAGCQRLWQSHVVVVGIGGVGSWAAEALARGSSGTTARKLAENIERIEALGQRLMAALHEENHGSRERLSSPAFTEPPKDYAPKGDDTPGTLHENFGLKSRH